MFDVRSRRVAVALVTLVAGGALAACGSASSASSTSSTTASASSGSSSGSGSGTSTTGGGPNSAKRAQLVSCLKSHGVTLPSRPAGAGGAPPGGGAPPAGGGTGTTGTGTTPRRGLLLRWRRRSQHLAEAASRLQSVRRELRLPRRRRRFRRADLAHGDYELCDVCESARLQTAEPELLGQGRDLPPEHRDQREVPGRGQVLPAPADSSATERGDQYDIGGLKPPFGELT